MRHVSGPAQPSLFTANACASVRRNRFLTPDMLQMFRNQRTRIKKRLATLPDAPKTRTAYDREYDYIDTGGLSDMKKTGLAVAFALMAVPAFAQTVVVPRGQTFSVEWNSEYPNDGVIRYRAWVDSVLTKYWTQAELTATPVTDLTQCRTGATACYLYRATHPSLNNTGTRRIKLASVDAASDVNSPFTAEVAFTVGTVPYAPTNPRVVVVTTQAGITFEFKSVPVTVEPQPQSVVVRVPPR